MPDEIPRVGLPAIVATCRQLHLDLRADSARCQDDMLDNRAELIRLTDQLAEVVLMVGALARDVQER